MTWKGIFGVADIERAHDLWFMNGSRAAGWPAAVARLVGGRRSRHAAGDRGRLCLLARGTRPGDRDLRCTSARRPGPLDDRADRGRRRPGPLARSRPGGRFYRADRARDEWNSGEPDPRASSRPVRDYSARRPRRSSSRPTRLAWRERLQALAIDTPPTRIDRPRRRLAERRDLSGCTQAGRRRRLGGYVLSGRCPEPAGPRTRDAARACFSRSCPGTPMSASFLVDQGGQSWLDRPWGPSGWRSARAGSSIEGGRCPSPCPYALPQLKPAGRRGRRPARIRRRRFHLGRRARACHHPRDQPATDDFLRRAVPACSLPDCWHGHGWPLAIRAPAMSEILAGLAESLHGTTGRVSFEANGELHHDDVGALSVMSILKDE